MTETTAARAPDRQPAMKRADSIRLALLGGGALLALGGCEDRQAECERARAEARPDAREVCERAGSNRSAGGSSGGGSRSGAGADPGSGGHSASARGGFGGSAHAGS